jgi:N-methylhydantoinase B
MCGRDPQSGSLYAYGKAIGGGFGASVSADGESAVTPPIANLRDTPVEALELSPPIRIERYGLVGASGGVGKFRGGLGIRRYFRMLSPATCAFQISMNRKPPYGVEGGGPGAVTRVRILTSEGQLTTVDAYTTYEAQTGDVIMIDTAGGGGYVPQRSGPRNSPV